jgi:pyruvate/2-oxoglutarate dehydrogenase complex dihydrolipoamide dehydrogenase (E3) component
VLGGGPIGCELSQAFRRFGSQVTVVEMADRFLAREDDDAAALLLDALRQDGVDVRLSTRLVRVERGEGRGNRAVLERSGKQEIVPFDEILVAVGRTPNVEGLGLEQAGVDYDPREGVSVDDHLRTRNPNVYAAGDVCMAHKFTHAADFAARAVIQNALFSVGPFGRRRLSALTIPWCTYTDPEIAHVGVSERTAAERGIEIDTYVRELRDVDRAIAEGRDEGFVKIHTGKGGDRIVGATIVGHAAGDWISEVSVAMAGGMGLGALSAVIHPYPTTAEAIRQTGDAYNRTRLTPRVKRIFERWLAWRR